MDNKENQWILKYKLECDVCKREIGIPGYVCDDCKRELINNSKKEINIREEIRSRVDGFAYPVVIFMCAGLSYVIAKDHGWGISIFIFILQIIILELAYRLSNR